MGKEHRKERQSWCILFSSPRIHDVIGDALFYLPSERGAEILI